MNATIHASAPIEMEKSLFEHEQLCQTLFEASTDAIFMETIDGPILDCNTTACRMFGYTRGEFLNLTVADLIPTDMIVKLPDLITEEIITGGIFIEAQNRRKDGHLFPVEVNTQMVTIGKETWVVVYIRDMTDPGFQRIDIIQP